MHKLLWSLLTASDCQKVKMKIHLLLLGDYF